MCQLRWNVIGNNGNGVWVVGAAEGVHIGIVRKRIIGDEWRLAVRRCPEVQSEQQAEFICVKNLSMNMLGEKKACVGLEIQAQLLLFQGK